MPERSRPVYSGELVRQVALTKLLKTPPSQEEVSHRFIFYYRPGGEEVARSVLDELPRKESSPLDGNDIAVLKDRMNKNPPFVNLTF